MSRCRIALLAIMLLAVARPATAEPDPQIFNRDWMALSTTAMGITGDARMTPDSITFNKRVVFKLRYLKEIVPQPKEGDWGDTPVFWLYEIVDPKPRAINNGNHFCGHPQYARNVPVARYLAIGLDPGRSQDELNIVSYASPQPPEAMNYGIKGFCGSYGYFYRK